MASPFTYLAPTQLFPVSLLHIASDEKNVDPDQLASIKPADLNRHCLKSECRFF